MNSDRKTVIIRINDILLGALERRALQAMARRLPGWIVPDHLTFLGLFAALWIGVCYWLTSYSLNWLWAVNAGLVVHWAADSLDGTLARTRHIERERYGFYIDHYSDTVAVFLVCIGMGLSPLLDLPIALLLIIGYYAMMMLTYLISLSRHVFKISFGRFGPTEARLVLILANIVVWWLGNPLIPIGHTHWTLFSLIGTGMVTLLLSFYAIFGWIEGRVLSRLDPPPSGNGNAPVENAEKTDPAAVSAGK